jgi:hypothetical protein
MKPLEKVEIGGGKTWWKVEGPYFAPLDAKAKKASEIVGASAGSPKPQQDDDIPF